MSYSSDRIEQHYDVQGLLARVRAWLESNGSQGSELNDGLLRSFDAYRVSERSSSLDLAETAGLTPGGRVLELGCGLGSNAAKLVDDFSCRVTGVDCSRQLAGGAYMLSRLVDPHRSLSFEQADARALPFEEDSFDAVLSQFVLVNIAEKEQVISEAKRVLKPSGVLALEEIVDSEGNVEFPTLWAVSEDLSWISTSEELIELADGQGFTLVVWEDVSPSIRQALESRYEKMPASLELACSPEDSILRRLQNLTQNLRQRSFRVVQAVFEAPE